MMATLFSLIVIFNVFVVYGFLLNNGNSKTANASGSNSVVTLPSFLEFKEQIHLELETQQSVIQQQHRSTEQLRETMKQTLSILTSQLNEKLQEIGAMSGQNNSCIVCENILQDNAELKINVSKLQKELELSNVENVALKSQLLSKTSNFESRLHIIEASENIKTQLDFKNLTKQIELIQAKTHNLENTQLARGQDLVALFKTLNDVSLNTSKGILESENMLYEKIALLNASFVSETTEKIVQSENILNGKIALLNASIVSETTKQTSYVAMLNKSFLAEKAEREAVQHRLSGSLTQLSDKVNDVDLQVAFTACASRSQNQSSGYIIRFDTIKTNVGVTDPSSFISSGKFLCEHDGIYLVSVSLTAYNTYINYLIIVNRSRYVQVYEQDNKVLYQRGDVTVTLNLHKGDHVWIQLDNHVNVFQSFSCFTVAKTK